jgi:ribose-phosphate pyrophosphokinase
VYNVIGDVKGKNAILVDDIIDTAGTICAAAELLAKEGATRVYAMAAHPVFSGPAIDRLAQSVFDEVIVTNSLPLRTEGKQVSKITQLSIAPLMGEAIRRIHDDMSVSEMFE